MAGDCVGTADQILPAAARHRLAVGHHLRAGMAIFGLSEVLVAVRIRHLRSLGSATGECESGHAEARGASPPLFARTNARFNARNAHDAYSVADKRRFRVLNADPHRGGKRFPNHQAFCALLTLLRFEFANEFRPSRAEVDPARRCGFGLVMIRRRRRPPASHAREVTPNRGENVASPRRGNLRGSDPFLGASHERRILALDGSLVRGSQGQALDCDQSSGCNLQWRKKAGRPERGSTRTAQFFWKRQCCQMNLLQALPAGANRVASISAASLSGSKGVLDPKVQVQARRGVTH